MSNRDDLARAVEKNATLKSAEASFREGWRDAISGMTIPLADLWDDIETTVSKEEEECDLD